MNAAVLFIALLFFGGLWGSWCLLIGPPLTVIGKVMCDRVESLKPAGELRLESRWNHQGYVR